MKHSIIIFLLLVTGISTEAQVKSTGFAVFEKGGNEYPMMPGHEILGQVVKVGKNVTMFKVGDYVGIPASRNMPSLQVRDLVFSPHRDVFGSLIGGISETQEALDYAVAHDIYPDVEIIQPDAEEIDKAYRNVQDGKVKFRYVIDMRNMK